MHFYQFGQYLSTTLLKVECALCTNIMVIKILAAIEKGG